MSKIKKLRFMKFISQKKLAEMIGVSQAAVCMWENGKNKPDWENAKKLAQIFGVTLDELLKDD